MPARKKHSFGGLELGARSIPSLLKHRAKRHPRKVFLQVWSHVNGLQKTVSYEQLHDRVMQLKSALASLGVRRGTHVALLSHNCVEYLILGLAVMTLHAVPVNLNWRQPVNLLEATVKLAKCRLVFASQHFWESAKSVCSVNQLPPPISLVDFTMNLVADVDGIPADTPGTSNLDGGSIGDEVAVVFFTSGSTKTPKAVPHTHNELMWLAQQYIDHLDEGKPDTEGGSLCLFPFFHVMGYVHNFLYNLYAGMRVIIHQETADTAISPDLMLRAITELKPSIVNTVPWIVEGFCQMLQDKDPAVQCVKDLRYISYGGAALPDYCREILNAHNVNAMMSYGQTEVGAAVMFTIPGGSLEYMQLLPGVEYELISEDGADVASQDQGRTGELVLLGQYSTTKAYLPGSNARPLAPPDSNTYERYRTGDVFEEHILHNGTKLLAYRCRHDDLVVHKTGEMSHPIPTEQAILTHTSNFVNKLCYFGQGRTAALLAIELLPGKVPEDVAGDIWKAISKANAIQPSYSAVTHNAVVLIQPDKHTPLPCTNKGNVQRPKVEKMFASDFTAENPTVDPSRGVALTSVLGHELLAELDEQEWDSLDFTSKGGRQPPFLIKQFHAYFVAMIAIVVMHMCGARGGDQHAFFLEKAGTQPEFLRGLPHGAQLFALPTFIVLMGMGDQKSNSKEGKGSVAGRVWRDIGRPLLLYFVGRYFLPAVAGFLIHPYYGGGKGGHVTFTWIFMFMAYARGLTQLLVRGLKLPHWVPAVLALLLHFGCYAGNGWCPSPFARNYVRIGPLPALLNCPRFSVYYPLYAVAPLVISEKCLLSKRLTATGVRVAASVVFAIGVLWAMGGFNLDTSYMAMESYGCRGASKESNCVSSWSLDPFLEDLLSLVGCTLITATLLVACPTKPSFASAIGQRSLIALIVHLYAIFALTPPLQSACRWIAATFSPVILPAFCAVALCAAVQIVCALPFTIESRSGSKSILPKIVIIEEAKHPVIVSLALVGILCVMSVNMSL